MGKHEKSADFRCDLHELSVTLEVLSPTEVGGCEGYMFHLSSSSSGVMLELTFSICTQTMITKLLFHNIHVVISNYALHIV